MLSSPIITHHKVVTFHPCRRLAFVGQLANHRLRDGFTASFVLTEQSFKRRFEVDDLDTGL